MRLAFDKRFSIPVNGTTYSVGIATKEAFECLTTAERAAEGITDQQQAIICISESVPDHRRAAVFWHEYIHSTFGEYGALTVANLLGCGDDFTDRAQENLATMIGPMLAGSLAALGFDLTEVLAGPACKDAPGKPRRRGRQ